MPGGRLSKLDLSRELSDFQDQYPKLTDDHLFVLWFLRAFLSDSIEQSVDALTGGANDKGIDAILEDKNTKNIFIIQGKYRESIGKKRESRVDVIGFADIVLDKYLLLYKL